MDIFRKGLAYMIIHCTNVPLQEIDDAVCNNGVALWTSEKHIKLTRTIDVHRQRMIENALMDKVAVMHHFSYRCGTKNHLDCRTADYGASLNVLSLGTSHEPAGKDEYICVGEVELKESISVFAFKEMAFFHILPEANGDSS